ncbi:MAG TPA: XRE family transcriptional regulator [Deltaproteobacteria bacterium]|nr:XRE family transcriptional regulator [Deltaproteobacteria bacterium]
MKVSWRELEKDEIEKYGEPALILRGARKKEDLTQVELSHRLGVPQSNIAAMESGKRPIGKAMARRLAKALNIDYRVFL